MDPHYRIPIRSIVLVSVVIALLSLINIGSAAALNAILSLTTLALYVSYLIPIGLLVRKRLRRENIDFGPWHMGRFGLWVNLYALGFGVFIVIFLPFPAATPVTALGMNYAGPVFLALLLLALLDWFIRGRRNYEGPTKEVEAQPGSAPSPAHGRHGRIVAFVRAEKGPIRVKHESLIISEQASVGEQLGRTHLAHASAGPRDWT